MTQPHDVDPVARSTNVPPDDASVRPDGPDASDAFDADGADVPFDPALLAAARAYHLPPPPPVDAMWTAIQARRASAAAGASARGEEPPTTRAFLRELYAGSQRPTVRRRETSGRAARRWAPLAAAAAVLLAAGIGIGRYSTSPTVIPSATTIASVPAPSASSGAPQRSIAPRAVPPAGVQPAPDATPRRVAAALPAAPSRRHPAPSATVAAAAVRPDVREPTEPRPTEPRDVASAPLRAATDRHLADAEALLTAFSAVAGGAQGQLPSAAPDSAWARDLLVTTRLLLDSPAGRDPARRTLLESLELVLVQIARLPHADTPAERALIERAIQNGDLLARLRTAVPSGPVRRVGARGA